MNEDKNRQQRARPRLTLRVARHMLSFALSALLGVVLAGVAGFIWLGVHGKPDLLPWQTAQLQEEFTEASAARVKTLADYRRLEDKLFAELQRKVYVPSGDAQWQPLSRYSAGSRADASGWDPNYNRTYELPAGNARAGIIFIHGLTDSPYMFHELAARLHERGCWVVVLRLPGHGTAPSALVSTTWRDWAAAVRMAVKDLRGRLPANVPLYMVGFSTGAALSVEYSLASLEGEEGPKPDGLILLSPAIGVDPLAFLAIWQARFAALPGLGKMAWLDLIPEYDPYKYNSFPVMAGHQIYALTQVIEERIARLAKNGAVQGFPRTLVFQSVADATVSPLAVVQAFLGHLAPGGHALVVYDINRQAQAQPFLRPGARLPAETLLTGAQRPFDVTLITNQDESSLALVSLHRAPGGQAEAPQPLAFDWPTGIFSLSHTALPIAPDDPIYGAQRPAASPSVYLGRLEVLGEQGMLAVPANNLVRLRFNPFFTYQEARIEAYLGLTDQPPAH